EKNRNISGETILKYLPDYNEREVPAVFNQKEQTDFSEREILYKLLFDMKKDLNDLKKLVFDLMSAGPIEKSGETAEIIQRLYTELEKPEKQDLPVTYTPTKSQPNVFLENETEFQEPEEVTEETLSLEEKEKELIKKALKRYNGKRKYVAKELGISERTLYR